jgi:hypothetical protein
VYVDDNDEADDHVAGILSIDPEDQELVVGQLPRSAVMDLLRQIVFWEYNNGDT